MFSMILSAIRNAIDGLREAPVIDRLGMRLVQQMRRGVEGTREQVEINRRADARRCGSRSGSMSIGYFFISVC